MAGSQDGPAEVAMFQQPVGIAVDALGTRVLVADKDNNMVREIVGGWVATVAGTTAGAGQGGWVDGPALTDARFFQPQGIALGAGTQPLIYVADYWNYCVRMISNGNVTTLAGGRDKNGYADGALKTARFDKVSGVAVDAAGAVYVADQGNHRIRRIADGQVMTLAGEGTPGFADGRPSAARFNGPTGIAVSGSSVYIADTQNHRIREISASGQVTTLAGSGNAGFQDGVGVNAAFNTPTSVAVYGSTIYVADSKNHRIRSFSAVTRSVTTLAGDGTAGFNDGPLFQVRFNQPTGVAVDGLGRIYVGEYYNPRVRMINPH